MGDLAIRVENLSKQYRIGGPQARYKTIRESLVEASQGPFRRLSSVLRGQSSVFSKETIWALKDVSFEVKRGEVLGIIGRNGAGKTTLLKVLSRITKPTEGRAEIHGRVGSLLEVGTGFHPELTGRENIYLNGAILGMKRVEIEAKFDEIVQFAEIERFLDTPVKRYSSGMYVRLAFAVAAHLEPEILLVDEVLAVGDAAFQKKCLGKMGDVSREGRTVLFVSHNMGAISTLCTRAFLLEEGCKAFEGEPEQTIRKYLAGTQSTSAEWVAPARSEYQSISLRAVRITDSEGCVRSDFESREPIVIEMDVDIQEWTARLKVGFELHVDSGGRVFTTFHNDLDDLLDQNHFRKGMYRFRAVIPHRLLNSHVYFVSPCAGIHRSRWLFREEKAVQFQVQFQVDNPAFFVGRRRGLVGPLLQWNVSALGSTHER